MSISQVPLSLSVVGALFAWSTLGAAELNNNADALPPIINTVCPMTGNDIDAAKSPTVLMSIGEGAECKKYRIAMCSDACVTEFKKDPAAALKPKFGKNAPGPKTLYK